jgi:FtsH-binding integral membrane protein
MRFRHPVKKHSWIEKKEFWHTMTLLGACGLALIFVIVLFLNVTISDPNRFYFKASALTVFFFITIGLLLVDMAGIALIRVLIKNPVPTFDEYRKDQPLSDGTEHPTTRFPELALIDAAHPGDFEEVPSSEGLTLASLCSGFRDYMASSLGLYYTEADARRFVASLSVSKTMILQGMSGTGKTSIAVAFGRYIGVPSSVVPVQPMWKERSDLLGYYNEFTGRFNETPILERLYEASFSDRMYVIVLDELNIARVEYYFSEFLSLLELPPSSGRELTVAASGAPGDPRRMSHGRIALPANVWFLGTANNDDSTFAISDKVYDRAMVMDLNSRADPYSPSGKPGPVSLSASAFQALAEKARKESPLSEAGLARVRELDSYLVSTFHVTFGNRILMQMRAYAPVYAACGGTEQGALDDILARKVLRKLEAQNPVYVRSKAGELLARIDQIFGQDSMPECQDCVRRLANNG